MTIPSEPGVLPFSDAARSVVDLADGEAVRRAHGFVGTEHIVLALGASSSGATVLRSLAIEPSSLVEQLDGIIARGDDSPTPDAHRPYTTRTRHSLRHASASAEALGRSAIGIPDLVVGILRERMNIGAQVLVDAGATLDRAEQLARDATG